MLKNYLLVALRTLRRERVYAVINVAGLGLGLAICLMVMAYVIDEWSYDSFHANAERLYRVNQVRVDESGTSYSANTPFPLKELITDNIPEAESAFQFLPMVGVTISANGRAFHEMLSIADSAFFSALSFPLQGVDPARALSGQSSIVLSASYAEKFFGSSDPLGQRVNINWGGKTNEFVVSGVVSDAPPNSSISFKAVIAKQAINRYFRVGNGWNTSWPETYILARPGVSREAIQGRLDAAARTIPTQPGAQSPRHFELQPITELHLNPAVQGSAPNVSSPVYSYLLCAIGVVVLLLACINFTTLAIGRTQRRVREIGARKVMGAGEGQIIGQVLGETLAVAGLGMLMAIVLSELLLPQFNELSGKNLTSIIWTTGWWFLPVIALVLVTALLAGGYPALVLSRVGMIEALRGKAVLLTSRHLTRSLVVLQFSISAALIVVTICMSKQMRFMIDAPLGFDKEQLVMIRLDGSGQERLATVERLRNSLSPVDGVSTIAASSTDFTGGGIRKSAPVGPDSSEFSIFLNPVDFAYASTMALKFVAGTDFTAAPGAGGSAANVIVNESLVKQLNWIDPIGREVPLVEGSRVIGVVRDYHVQPFTSLIEPLVLLQSRSGDDWCENLSFAFIRLSPGDVSNAMLQIEKTWHEVAPNLPFDYEFMDAHIEAQYRSYRRWSELMATAAILAALIACFGVFGLTAHAVARRRKEIGIRRVLGARSSQLVALLNREFVLLAIVGNILAWPAAYFSVNRWLQEFAYRSELSIWPFVAGMGLLLVVVVLTVSSQAVRAASVSPVEVIRYE